MRLFTTLTSPYGRIARALIIEKGYEDKIELVPTVTRTLDTPVLDHNPSGRVPTLVFEDGRFLEDTKLICEYIDSLENPPALAPLDSWEAKHLEARVRSMLDGIAVWVREVRRPANEQSPDIVAHETRRALRLAGVFNQLIANGACDGPLDLAQLTLACTLHRPNGYPNTIFDWRDGNANLSVWIDRMSERRSLQETLPPT